MFTEKIIVGTCGKFNNKVYAGAVCTVNNRFFAVKQLPYVFELSYLVASCDKSTYKKYGIKEFKSKQAAYKYAGKINN